MRTGYVTHTDGCAGKCGTAFDNPTCPGADMLMGPLERISREGPEWVQAAAVDLLSWLRDEDDESRICRPKLTAVIDAARWVVAAEDEDEGGEWDLSHEELAKAVGALDS